MIIRMQDKQSELSDNSLAENNDAFPHVLKEVIKGGSKLSTQFASENPVLNNRISELLHGNTIPTLYDLQSIIVEFDLCESVADRLTGTAGYKHIGAHLALAYLLSVDLDFVLKRDLKNLLIAAIHSELLGIDIYKIEDQLPENRPHNLSDKQFDKLKIFIMKNILPLVRENRFPSITDTIIKDVISPYPPLDYRSKELLSLLVYEAAGAHTYLQPAVVVIDRGMGKDRKENEILDKMVGDAINELRSNPRTQHPTDYEKILMAFRSKRYDPIEVSELGQALFDDSSDSKRATQFKISKLNSRIAEFDLQIERRTTYSLKQIKINPKGT